LYIIHLLTLCDEVVKKVLIFSEFDRI